MKLQSVEVDNIRNKIFTIRGKQVMLDRDLAVLYGVETRALNQAAKRNLRRFPERFMFQLTNDELKDWMSQIVISNKELKGLRKAPYAFTEQGVSMLSAVLNSQTAIDVSIKIIDAFVSMRHFIATNGDIFRRIEGIETRQIEHKKETDQKINEVFTAIEEKDIKPKQGIFYDGQIFDAYRFTSSIIRSAKISIILIDNYIDESVLVHLAKRRENVEVILVMKEVSKSILLDVKKFNQQYYPVRIKELSKAHDRFLIIDKKVVYHFGASLKDLGKKWFAFSKMDIEAAQMLAQLDNEAANSPSR